MKRFIFLPCLGLAACASEASHSTSSDDFARAQAAIELLEEQDEGAVAGCRGAVANCEANLPDAAPSTVCSTLTDHCNALEERLADISSHAVGCWRGVESCVEHAPPQAECHSEAERCDDLDDDMADNRGPVVECSSKVELCLASVPEDAAEACDELSLACEHVGELSARAEAARAQGAANSGALTEEAQAALDGLPPVDLGGTIPPVGQAGDAGMPEGILPPEGRGGSQAADAGTPVELPSQAGQAQ